MTSTEAELAARNGPAEAPPFTPLPPSLTR